MKGGSVDKNLKTKVMEIFECLEIQRKHRFENLEKN